MKFKLRLNKNYEIDTDKDWSGDLALLYEYLDAAGVEAGGTADADQIYDAIRSMLGDEIESVVDLNLSDRDFEIDIPIGTEVEVPALEEEEEE